MVTQTLKEQSLKKMFLSYECFACIYVYVPCVLNAQRGQKKASESMEPELQVVVNSHVGVGN